MARKRRRPLARGWYEKGGDPPGTERFWDGEKWGPNPRQKKGAAPAVTKKSSQAVVDAAAATPAAIGELSQGSIWARISARSADIVLLVVPVYWLLTRAYVSQTVEAADGTADVVLTTNIGYLAATAAVVVAYEVGFTTTWGATPGKRLMGLVVADKDTLVSPLSRSSAVMRAIPLVAVVAPLLAPVLWIVSVAAMYFDGRQRSVFDLSAGTVVLLDPTREQRPVRAAKKR